jgi:cell division septal protein FtsQ
MKEQVIASRGPRRAAAQPKGPKGIVQRPARRNGAVTAGRSFSPRALFGYLPAALKVGLAVLVLTTLIVGYRVAASAALFQVRTIDVTGTTRTSAEEIEGLTRRAVARTGVWRADLNAISRELSRLPGVRRAVVSRVLPDRLRVRVTERVPVAIVHTAGGHFVWVDDEGVALGEMKPDDQMPAFFVRGWNEDGTEEARQENVERVKKYLELVREWNALGLSERVSEVTLIDLRDIRVQLAGKDSQVEVRLGSEDQGPRLKTALDALDEYKQTPRGSAITYVSVQTSKVTIGSSSGNKEASDSSDAATQTPGQTSTSNTNASAGEKNNPTERTSANDNRQKNERKPAAPKDSPATGTGRFR